MRWLALVAALAGCNALLGLDDVSRGVDAAGDFVPCTPLPFDPSRYARIGTGFTWQEARSICLSLGFDLAVLDDGDSLELANEINGAQSPFWLGVSYGTQWEAVDGCTPNLTWAPGEPSATTVGSCVIKNPLGMASRPCSNGMPDGVGASALCETSRPSVHCMATAQERTYMVTSDVTWHDDAADICASKGMHLVVIDSQAELDYILANVAQAIPSFWLGVGFGNGRWTSVTGCPEMFAWAPSEPTSPDGCAYYISGGMHSANCQNQNLLHNVICESNVAP